MESFSNSDTFVSIFRSSCEWIDNDDGLCDGFDPVGCLGPIAGLKLTKEFFKFQQINQNIF
jgi:hypothetical protein